jgi:fructokinase
MSDWRRPDVLVIGEALVDIVDTPGGRGEHVGGSPANVALGLGRRGVGVALLTQFGDDERGRTIAQHLSHSGVDVLAESVTRGPTSTAWARLAPDGQAEYDFDVSWGPVRHPAGLLPRVVHTGSIAVFLAPGGDSVRGVLHDSSASEITFDPNIRPALVGPHDVAFRAFAETAGLATVLKMSDQDAAWLYPDLPIDDVLQELLLLGPRLVAVTLGSEGAIVANAEHRVWIPPVEVDPVDTIGAGDTFMASLIHSVLEHGSVRLDRHVLEALGREAGKAAAITVSRAGADLPWASEL